MYSNKSDIKKCRSCGVGINSRSRCKKCLKIENEKTKKRQAKRKAEGLCPRCGSETNGFLFCDRCLENRKKLLIKRKANNLCIICNKKTSGLTMCDKCNTESREYQNKKRARLKDAGLCAVCGKETEGLTLCFKCLDSKRQAAGRRRVKKKGAFAERVSIEKVFFRDGGRCHICKRKLNLEVKYPNSRFSSIDHIIPISKGGTHEYKNVKLACFECNVRKGNRSIDGGEQLLMFGQ